MKKYSLGATVETLLDSVGHKVEVGKNIQLHIYADFAGEGDEVFFHDGRMILHITEGTVLHCEVNDVTKSVRIVPNGKDLFKLEFADFNPYTSEKQAVFRCSPDKVDLFEADWKVITQGNDSVKIVEHDAKVAGAKLS